MNQQGVTKLVSGRVAISRTVLSSVDVHGADVAEVLAGILFPQGAPPALTVPGLLTALHDALESATGAMTEADVAHARELSDDEAPRLARENGIAALRAQMIGLRATFTTVYGAGILGAYGLVGETPEDPESILQRAASTAQLLKSRPITETPRQPGITIDAPALGDALLARAVELRGALGDIRREEREAQMTLARRDEAVAIWNKRYQGVADIITGIYELVGRADLADRVRPTARRRAGLTEDADTTPAPNPPAPAQPA
ncbi:Hypothetical protein A7982_08816 [Minicystis rosea]|nr:Hypothetical protein A7982_08816 [Minicystis rosea]